MRKGEPESATVRSTGSSRLRRRAPYHRPASRRHYRASAGRGDLFLYSGAAPGQRYDDLHHNDPLDYHSIDHNLLKLDILGHDDPTMIRMLQDLTGLDPVKDIPLDSPEVMSLFQSTEALGITPDDIGGCPLGALGVPEFGTDFAMQMLLDTKPKYFSDLVRIAGLAHGTDVWLGNAQNVNPGGEG